MVRPKVADLHTHSVYSDGVLTLEELFSKAKSIGLSAISVTDHDTIDGCLECFEMSSKFQVDYITGVEFSCYEDPVEYHILGYQLDIDNPPLKKHLSEFRQYRYSRAVSILAKLEKLRKPIKLNRVLEIAGKAPIVRPHIATAMFEAGHVKSVKDAFQKYLGDWKPAYVPKRPFAVRDAIKLINQAGGLAVLAHPGPFLSQESLYEMIQFGLDGIEVNHPMHDESLKNFYRAIANQYWLFETGGSDFHGNKEFDEDNFGKIVVPYSIFESLKFHAG